MKSFGAGILLVREGHVVLTQRSATEHEPLSWSCFGGMSEGDETPQACAIRETMEESGIRVDANDLVFVDIYRQSDGTFEFTTFMAKVGSDVETMLSEESHAIGEFPLGDTVDLLWDNLPKPLHSGMLDFVASRWARTAVLAFLNS